MDKYSDIAYRIMESAKNQLFFSFRFLEMALYRMPWGQREEISYMGTDGVRFYYGKENVIRAYRDLPDAVEKSMLHTVLHCIFGHPFVKIKGAGKCWDLAADIAVAQSLAELGVNIAPDAYDILRKMDRAIKWTSAQSIYRYLLLENAEEAGVFGISFQECREMFAEDEHVLWISEKKSDVPAKENSNGNDTSAKEGEQSKGMDTSAKEKEQSEGTDTSAKEEEQSEGTDTSAKENENRSGTGMSADENIGKSDRLAEAEDMHVKMAAETEWKDISENILMNLMSFSKERGEQTAHMMQNLKELEKDRINYADFLKKFAVVQESMQLNPDEFDYIFYTYGLKLYEKMPLIEPLEYKETRLVRDFVIAIDTSGSCSGETVQRFLNKTYQILKESERLDRKVNIHIIQCDAEIQRDDVITTMEELDSYVSDLKLYGFGGTDFRPVFQYVDSLIRQQVFHRLCGLIYFTDGYGIFPREVPKYKTAFAFVDQEDIPKVPAWAMKVIWREESLYEY